MAPCASLVRAQEPALGFVTVEVGLGKKEDFQKFKVPIVAQRKRKVIDDQAAILGGGFTGSCSKDIGCEYLVAITADAVSNQRSKVFVRLSFRGKRDCDAEKGFIVIRSRTTVLKTKCGSRIRAYYE